MPIIPFKSLLLIYPITCLAKLSSEYRIFFSRILTPFTIPFSMASMSLLVKSLALSSMGSSLSFNISSTSSLSIPAALETTSAVAALSVTYSVIAINFFNSLSVKGIIFLS